LVPLSNTVSSFGFRRRVEVMTLPAQRGGYPSDLMTVSDVASLLRVSKMTVYRLMRAGEFTSVRVGQSFLVPRVEVAEYLRRSQLGGPEEPAPHGNRGASDVHAARLPTAAAGAPEDAADDLSVRADPRAARGADLRPAQRLAPGAEELTGNRLDAHHPARQATRAAWRGDIAEKLLAAIPDIVDELPAELVVEYLELVAAFIASHPSSCPVSPFTRNPMSGHPCGSGCPPGLRVAAPTNWCFFPGSTHA
jgi:excisionase family DNA binding protein